MPTYIKGVEHRHIGNFATADLPTGDFVGAGDLAFDTTTEEIKVYDGSSWSAVGSGGGSAPTGADVELTGYTIGSAGAVAATDSVNEAIGKLEARIAAIE